MNAAVAVRNLAEIAHVLTSLKVTWVLAAGTLLGVVREGHLLDHDHDTDIAVIAPADHHAIKHALCKLGFAMTQTFGVPEHGFEMRFERDGVWTDVFWDYLDGDVLWHACWDEGKMMRYEVTRFNPVPCDALGFPAFIPHDSERYLAETYGDWRQVVKEWDYRTDPKCRVS